MGRQIDRRERDGIDRRNRELLAQDLLEKRLLFSSRPYEAHVQFSNFCNMSCIMCWDGENPPLQKMAPRMIARVADEMAPHLTVITPHGGSEPLIVTWDETRRMAEQFSVDLCLTTNVQFLDEEKFHELETIVETIVLSIDSHIEEIFEKIRPRSRPKKVFENLATTARLAEEREIECLAQIVFMTENAAMLPETIAYMADSGIPIVNVIQLIDFNGRSGYSDPLLHFSAEYVEWTKQRCIDVAREKKIALAWLEHEFYEFREKPVRPKSHRVENNELDDWAKHAFPGYCRYVYNRLRVHLDGEVAPCGWATEGDLVLGNVGEQNFDQIWNGVNARDLRRAHQTWDYPTLCKHCRFTDTTPPREGMPFVPRAKAMIGDDLGSPEPTLSVIDPPHMAREVEAPTIRVETPGEQITGWFLALSLGGGISEQARPATDELNVSRLVAHHHEDGTTTLTVTDDLWRFLRTNVGYWWAVFAVPADDAGRALRSRELRCLIRHERIERIAGSTLTYPDQEARPLADLGGAKQRGWTDRSSTQARPRIRQKPSGLWSSPRPARSAKRGRQATDA
jgi:radical SAM protein with 4Fe4S-binding SPASM domain